MGIPDGCWAFLAAYGLVRSKVLLMSSPGFEVAGLGEYRRNVESRDEGAGGQASPRQRRRRSAFMVTGG